MGRERGDFGRKVWGGEGEGCGGGGSGADQEGETAHLPIYPTQDARFLPSAKGCGQSYGKVIARSDRHTFRCWT